MRISQLKHLQALHQYGSFSRAAKELFISQPSISASIKELEIELGYQILARSNRGITFTPRGELALKHVESIMSEIGELFQLKYQNDDLYFQKKIRLTSSPLFLDTILIDTIIALKKKYETFDCNLSQSDSGGVIKELALNQSDIGVILITDSNENGYISEIKKNHLNYFVLFEDEMCFLANKDHSLANKEDLSLQEILKFQQVFCFTNFLELTISEFKQMGYAEKNIIIENVFSLLKFIATSQTLGLFIKTMYLHDLKDRGDLIMLLPKDFHLRCKVLCVYRDEISSFEEKEFTNVLINICERYQNL